MRLTTRLLLACRRDLRRRTRGQAEQGRLDRLCRAVNWLRGRLGERLAAERMVECALGEAAYAGAW
jgi:hypothetical protein